MPEEIIYQTLLSPVNSEKANVVGEKNNQYIFKVAPWARKSQIKKAVESIFEVPVLKVTTLCTKPELRRDFRGGKNRCIKSYKKAYVSVAPGKEINILSNN